MSGFVTKNVVYEKIKNYLSDDHLIDKDELFSLLQYAKKSGISEEQLDLDIASAKEELGFTEEASNIEEIYRESVYKLSNGDSYDKSFEFYIKEQAKDVNLQPNSTERLLKKIKSIDTNKVSSSKKKSLFIYLSVFSFFCAITLSILAYLNESENSSESKETAFVESKSEALSPSEKKDDSQIQDQKSFNYSFLYHRENKSLNIDTLINDLVYLKDPGRSRYLIFIASLKHLINQSPYLDTPMGRYLSRFYDENDENTKINKVKFKKLTAEYINEEKLLTLIHRISSSSSRIPEVDVYKGLYLEKAQEINWSQPDRAMLMLMELYQNIKQDLRSGYVKKSKKSASQILEVVRMASIVPIVYYHQSMNAYVGPNSFTKYSPSQILLQVIPERYSAEINFSNEIESIKKYESFLEQVVQMTGVVNQDIQDFKKSSDYVRDYEMLGLLSFLQSFALHSDAFLTLLDIDKYFSTIKPTILVTDYKPLTDIYFKLERLLLEAENILEMITTADSDLDFIRLSVEPIKIMHQHLLLLSRVVFFDMPLASDSLQTLLKIKNAKGWVNDNERLMVEAGQLYASLKPVLLKFYVSPSVHEMWQEIMKTLKDELSKNEFNELNQRSKTQPAWLERPKLES